MSYLIKVFMFIIGIKGSINLGGLDLPIITRGDGLYQNGSKAYVYKGRYPHNYILFDGGLWRILSIDENIRIMKNESIDNIPFDEDGSNKWNNSSLKKYLNTYYYNSLSSKSIINGEVQIISFSEYLNSNSNKDCSNESLYFRNFNKCFNSSYINFMDMNNRNHAVWTSSGDDSGSKGVFYIGNTYFGDGSAADSDFGVLPVLNLDKNIKLIGEGTLQNPYKIKK